MKIKEWWKNLTKENKIIIIYSITLVVFCIIFYSIGRFNKLKNVSENGTEIVKELTQAQEKLSKIQEHNEILESKLNEQENIVKELSSINKKMNEKLNDISSLTNEMDKALNEINKSSNNGLSIINELKQNQKLFRLYIENIEKTLGD